jgi:hypothetical protein
MIAFFPPWTCSSDGDQELETGGLPPPVSLQFHQSRAALRPLFSLIGDPSPQSSLIAIKQTMAGGVSWRLSPNWGISKLWMIIFGRQCIPA